MSEVNWHIGMMVHLESPWGNAGGVVRSVEEVEAMAKTGVGWLEPGSYTLEERLGNQYDTDGNLKIDAITNEPVAVYYHDPATAETTNSIGMKNQGMDQLVLEAPEMIWIAATHNKEIVFNIAPVTDDPATEVYEMAARLADVGVRRILVNLGCPNVLGPDGLAHSTLSHHPQVVGQVLDALKPLMDKYPDLDIYVRPSPDEDNERLDETHKAIIASGIVKAAWIHNTWPLTDEEKANSPLGVAGGGRSGSSPRLISAANAQLERAVASFKKSGIDIVMSTSIRNAERLKKVMDLGAVAGAGTTFYYEAQEAWTEATDRLLTDFSR
jgi:dihydroorotate dehydrogenase